MICFNTTSHDRTIYRAAYKPTGDNIYLLRQVDYFLLACSNESVTEYIYTKNGGSLQLTGESDKPFSYLGLVEYFNGIDIEQSREYIQISCQNYIDRVIRSHHWNGQSSKFPDKPPSPLPPDSLKKLFGHSGTQEGTN